MTHALRVCMLKIKEKTITDAMEMATDYLGLVCWDEGRRTPPEWIQKLIIEKIESVV